LELMPSQRALVSSWQFLLSVLRVCGVIETVSRISNYFTALTFFSLSKPKPHWLLAGLIIIETNFSFYRLFFRSIIYLVVIK
jgi:hypothetical protein